MFVRFAAAGLLAAMAWSQTPAAPPTLESSRPESSPAAQPEYIVDTGTHILLSLINSVSTKYAAPGDRLYLETAFPILVNGKIVIPPGSYVAGTVTDVKRPGRVKGRAELYVRFDSLTLPNGTTRDFRARVGALDGRANEQLDKAEGKIAAEGNKSGDLRTIGEAAATGTSVGVIAGAAAGSTGMGAGIGAAAGAAAGLAGVLLSRGPEAILAKGTTLEMVLDRQLVFTESEIPVNTAAPHAMSDATGPLPSVKQQQKGVPIPGGRLPM
jgi:hypothetical protein